MDTSTLLPDAHQLRLERIIADDNSLTLDLTTCGATACCPDCGQPSHHVHSHYRRTLADLPWQGIAARLHLSTRRFFCTTASCPRHIFTERLPAVAVPYGRRTLRLHQALHLISLAVGGRPGARLATELGLHGQRDTLLRVLRWKIEEMTSAENNVSSKVRVLGVDDWAFRKGQRYGTILCDLEQRCPVDLLPERSAESLAQWLQEHPGIEIISRDRSNLYAEGATAGAPGATQVADRWHLLKNLRETVERLLDRHHSHLQRAAKGATQRLAPSAEELTQPAEPVALTCQEQLRQRRRERRHARYEDVLALHRQGVPLRTIAQQLRMGRHTVRRFIRAEAFPERHPVRPRPSQLDPFKAYLHERWEEGCHNAAQLWREIKDQGFAGCQSLVRHYLGKSRAQLPAALRRQRTGSSAAPQSPVQQPSSRRASWLLLYPEKVFHQAQRRGGVTEEKQQRLLREQLCEIDPEIQTATQMGQEFIRIVQERQSERLKEWLHQALESTIPELRSFAVGIRQDEAAVSAALQLSWSNGQVEGQVNRLKLLKRQMYGRANFDLLRLRVLSAV